MCGNKRSKFSKVALVLMGAFASACNGLNIRSADTASMAAPDPLLAGIHLRNTRLGLELKANQNKVGTVYYSVYDADPGTLTAAQAKAAASAPIAGPLVERGTIAVNSAGVDYTLNINTLADKKLYWVVAVGEGSDGLDRDRDVSVFSKVLPLSMTQLSYTKVSAPSAGTLVRYAASVPQDYYDNPNTLYPILIWLHGNGESFNDASNAEVNFTNLAAFMGPFKRLSNDLYGIPMIVIAPQCNYAFF